MSQTTIYPRLYTSNTNKGQGALQSKGDATLDTLYQLYVNGTINTTTWSYRQRVLHTALRLFDDMDKWFVQQFANPQLIGFNLEFLKDTLLFIRTGQRDISVSNWMELISESNSHSIKTDTLSTPIHLLKNEENTVSMIQKWCAQPRGFEDLITTLYILFGPAKQALS